MKKNILIFLGILFTVGILFVVVGWMFIHSVLFAVYRVDEDENVDIALSKLDFDVDDGDFLRYEEYDDIKGYRFRIVNISKRFSIYYSNLNYGQYKFAVQHYFNEKGSWFYTVAIIVLLVLFILDFIFMIVCIFKCIKRRYLVKRNQ